MTLSDELKADVAALLREGLPQEALRAERAAVEIDHLTAECGRLRADAERLDWLDGNLLTGHWNGVVDSGSSKYWLMRGDWRHQIQNMRGNTFREALDAARKS